MTIAECLLVLCLGAGIYYALRPLRDILQRMILKAMGREPKWIEAETVTRKIKKESSDE